MPLSRDSYELLQLILGCAASPSNLLLIQLVGNYDFLKLPLPLHAEKLLTCAESKYLYPQLRILIQVCYFRGELNYLILN